VNAALKALRHPKALCQPKALRQPKAKQKLASTSFSMRNDYGARRMLW
jgi:hypothetical protein